MLWGIIAPGKALLSTEKNWFFLIFLQKHSHWGISNDTHMFSWTINPQSASHNYCCLLCHLLVILKVISANSVDSDQTAPRSSLIRVHNVCLYAKSMFEKFARRCSRRHNQTFSDAGFLGALRVKTNSMWIPLMDKDILEIWYVKVRISRSISESPWTLRYLIVAQNTQLLQTLYKALFCIDSTIVTLIIVTDRPEQCRPRPNAPEHNCLIISKAPQGIYFIRGNSNIIKIYYLT